MDSLPRAYIYFISLEATDEVPKCVAAAFVRLLAAAFLTFLPWQSTRFIKQKSLTLNCVILLKKLLGIRKWKPFSRGNARFRSIPSARRR